MTAAETYAAHIDAVRAQRARLHGAQPPDDPWAGPIAQRFRADPHRPLDANLTVLASHIRPEDVLLDVGGGAGRVVSDLVAGPVARSGLCAVVEPPCALAPRRSAGASVSLRVEPVSGSRDILFSDVGKTLVFDARPIGGGR